MNADNIKTVESINIVGGQLETLSTQWNQKNVAHIVPTPKPLEVDNGNIAEKFELFNNNWINSII